jgi:repressor LexA
MLDGSGRRPHTVPVPIVGTIAAGSPIPVFEPGTSYGEMVDATEEQTKRKEHVYALRVKGTSMIDALVSDGDIVIMEKTSNADDGEMVAAWLIDEEETTLKLLFTDGDRIRLQPANETMKPIYTKPENLKIMGRVLTTIRDHN